MTPETGQARSLSVSHWFGSGSRLVYALVRLYNAASSGSSESSDFLSSFFAIILLASF